jgi:hypothetical protein
LIKAANATILTNVRIQLLDGFLIWFLIWSDVNCKMDYSNHFNCIWQQRLAIIQYKTIEAVQNALKFMA